MPVDSFTTFRVVKKFGRGGLTAKSLRTGDILNDVEDFTPDVVVLMIGGNDIDVAEPKLKETVADINAIFNRLRTHCPEVYVVEVLPRYNPTVKPALEFQKMRSHINQKVRNKIKFFGHYFIHIKNMNSSWIGPDGVHFIPRWYRDMAIQVRIRIS